MFSLGKTIGLARTDALTQRIESRIIADPRTECHLWTGAKATTRRGFRPIMRLRVIGRVIRVARLVLEWKEGPPPSPLHEAGHTCPHGEQELCVNPNHLTWMTREENEQWKRAAERRAEATAM